LRDNDEIGLYSTGIGAPSSKPVGRDGLTNGAQIQRARRHGQDNMTSSRRSATRPTSTNRALGIFRAEFMPMLNGKGPLTVTVGDKSQQLPLAGVTAPLQKFSATCFGKS
jgi:hypothetical protein